MAIPKPKPPEEQEDQQPVERRPLVGKLDFEALHRPQDPNSGINAIIGKWPADELSEEEFIALVEEIS